MVPKGQPILFSFLWMWKMLCTSVNLKIFFGFVLSSFLLESLLVTFWVKVKGTVLLFSHSFVVLFVKRTLTSSVKRWYPVAWITPLRYGHLKLMLWKRYVKPKYVFANSPPLCYRKILNVHIRVIRGEGSTGGSEILVCYPPSCTFVFWFLGFSLKTKTD